MFLKKLFQCIWTIFSLLFKRLTGPIKMRIFFERMGGAFMRLGQILALRQDFLSYRYTQELLKLSTQISPLPYFQMQKVFIKEKGMATESFFAEFDSQPVASTPLAQVYKAYLKDGTKVAVKIQRPETKQVFEEDFKAMIFLAFIADLFRIFSRVHLQEIVSEFICWSKYELDFTIESRNGYIIYKHSEQHPRTVVPRQYLELSSSRVLIQEFIENGIFVNNLLQQKRDDIEIDKLSYYLVFDVMRQYFIDGFFHADPHPTNLIFLPEAKLVYLDFGIVGKSESKRMPYLKILYGIATKNADYIAEHLFEFGEELIGQELKNFFVRTKKERENFEKISGKIKEFIIKDLREDIMKVINKDMNILILNIKKISEKYNIYLPREIILHLRTMAALNAIALEISPGFDIIKALNLFFNKYNLEEVERLTKEGMHEELHTEIIGIDDEPDWETFKEIMAVEKEKKSGAREKFIEMLAYYAEKYSELRSTIKNLKLKIIMKYPYVAISLIILWAGTTVMILKNSSINVSYFLLVALIGTIIISVIGFRPPRIHK
ncbi:hypothetical protein KKG15_02000 [Patescibacteria group bacterium]|nr:hypothetical protein [Patescibacteria group bacterium]